jgi:hypothetical protein
MKQRFACFRDSSDYRSGLAMGFSCMNVEGIGDGMR